MFLERKDPCLRFNDYDMALQKWSNTKLDIIFCENSGYDIIALKQKYKDVHFFQFDGLNYNQNLGKGYGEHLILEYLIKKNGHLFPENQFFCKVTGRLFVKNIKSYLDGFQQELKNNNELLIYSDFRLKFGIAESQCFVFNKKFALNYLLKYTSKINDNRGYYFENALADALLEALIVHKKSWRHIAQYPHLEGIAGTANKKYNISKIKLIKRYLYCKLKKSIIEL